MGRFYQTSTPDFVENAMFVLPYQQMSTALKEKDKAIDDTIQLAIKTGEVDIDAHQIDTQKAKEVKQKWDTKINTIVDNILNDPLNYGTQKRAILETGRELAKDQATGEIAALKLRKANIDALQKKTEELRTKNPIEYSHAQKFFEEELQKNSAFINPATGQINYFSPGEIYGAGKLTDYVEEAIKGAVGGNITEVTTNDSGMLTVHTEKGQEGFSPTDLKKLLDNYFVANPEIAKGVMQKASLGEIDLDKSMQATLDYMVDKYGRRVVKVVNENKLSTYGNFVKQEDYKESKESQVPGIYMDVATVNHLVNYRAFNDSLAAANSNYSKSSQEIVKILQTGLPKDNYSAEDKTGKLIQGLQKLQTVTGIDYSGKIEELKSSAREKLVANQTGRSFRNWLEENKPRLFGKTAKGTAEYDKRFNLAYAEWAGLGKDGYYGRPGQISKTVFTLEGYGSKGEIEYAQKFYEQKALTMPFQLQGQSFTMENNGKKTVMLFKMPGKDGSYLQWLKGGKKPWIGKDGKTYNYVDTGDNPTASTTTLDALVKKGYMEAPEETETTATITNIYDQTSTKAKKSSRKIIINPKSFGIAARSGENGQPVAGSSIQIGDQTLNLIHPMGVANSFAPPPRMQSILDATRDMREVNMHIQKYGGNDRLTGEITKIGTNNFQVKKGTFYMLQPNGKELPVDTNTENGKKLYNMYLEENILNQ